MKKRIILISILVGVLLLNVILFGFVFCLRKQSVKVVGESIEISSEEIIETANLKNGKSIFSINKDKAIENLEKIYPNLKVIQIKTTSVIGIEIAVRKRYETYFVENNSKFYVLDEDLKVLRIEEEKPTNLTEIKSKLEITNSTAQCDFVGSEFEKGVLYNLFTSIYQTVKIGEGEELRYLMRDEIYLVAESISFDSANTLTEKYSRLIIQTVDGVKLDIGKPEKDLQRKINACYSAMQSGEFDATSGSFKIYFTAEGEEKFEYFASTQEG